MRLGRLPRLSFFVRRMAQSALLIVVLICLNFLLIHLAPGDPIYLLAGQSGDAAYYEFIRAKFGLDQPLVTQLGIYLSNVARGDLGFSLGFQQPVSAVILSRIPATLLLMGSALVVSVVAGVWLGVRAAQRRGSGVDRAIVAGSVISDSIPSFCLGQAALLVFSLWLNLFPAQGLTDAGANLSGIDYWFDVVGHLVLPATTLAIVQLAIIIRLTRTQMLSVLNEDYVRTARAKGVSESGVLYRHGLRNALLPIVTTLGGEVGMLLSGAALIETVFAYPGIGRLLLEAVAMRDYPVLLGLMLMTSVTVVMANLLTDLCYSLLDPRIVTR